MIDGQILRDGLQRLLRDTEAAIRERIGDEPSIEAQLKERHAAAVQAGRTAGSAAGYNSFADEAITQSAVHWLLGCVFVRFLEDNGWLDERQRVVSWLAGPGDRLAIAKDHRTLFLRPDPGLTDRDYLLHVFSEVAKLPGVVGLFDPRHNPLFQLGPTAQGAARIVEFFQKVDPDSGRLIHDFTDEKHQTRFLGDLYQNLSESARKRYALCQTPGFVIDFILDRTLTPAIDTFGLDQVRLIDPSCGSGHFLLAAFGRLFRLWQQREPATNPPALAQKALDAVHGVDLNPFAAEISRFRLLIAALEASKVARLRDAFGFRIQVAAGDSLLHGRLLARERAVQRVLGHDPTECFYEAEDADALNHLLGQQYQVVIGNPPYIVVNDESLRALYRARYGSCFREYQLTVPFIERFFGLAGQSADQRGSGGFVGLIASNAFMKRSFGQKLVEDYIPKWDLTHVIDTSGVHIPDHGTPTVILFGRHQAPLLTTVRAVRGIRGETSRPVDPANAPVWRTVVAQVDQAGSASAWISVADAPRDSFQSHPWSIGGGGAAELKDVLCGDRSLLEAACPQIGFMAFTGEDDVYLLPQRGPIGSKLESAMPVVEGGTIRDWQMSEPLSGVWPYREDLSVRPLAEIPRIARHFWIYSRHLRARKRFGVVVTNLDMSWYEWRELYTSKLAGPLTIAYGEIATHNHFMIDRGGRVFKQTAPVIKLPESANEDDHLGLVGTLNSSSTCFWLKQVCYNKGTGGISEGLKTDRWEQFVCFNATTVGKLPLPAAHPVTISRAIQQNAECRLGLLPSPVCSEQVPTGSILRDAKANANLHLGRMIALQEELDWQVYHLYGLLDEDVSLPPDEVPPLTLGERAFEILLARKMIAGETATAWFERHGSTPITELPSHWPERYTRTVERRLEIIASNRNIALIEQPEYKRRWNLPTWEEMEQAALKNWLLDRMETNAIWHEHTPVSCSQLRDALSKDADWVSVAGIYNGAPVENLDDLVTRLAVTEAVPFLPVLRYTEIGLRKRAEWEQVWDLQRREDAGETVEIPVPPKYRTNDFQRSDYWRLRGGLDVPKERFITYPGLERDSDRTPVLGWAGWNHLEQAQALSGYYQRMRTEEGWEPERLKPILAGLLDLKPWLLQWHNDVDPETGVRLGEYFVQFAESQCQELGFSPESVRAWQPVTATNPGRRGRRRSQ